MVAELATPWPRDKFGKGTVQAYYYSQTSVIGIAKDQDNVTAIT